MRLLTALLLLLAIVGCGRSPNLEAWRGERSSAMATEGDPGDATPGNIDAVRARGDLAAARTLALALARMKPGDGEALWRASRAESDAVWLLPADDREGRDMAAASALDYARRAELAGANSAAALGQYAWALGNSTHLRAMFARAGHANETMEVIDRALAADPKNADALATAATLHLRLATLPWIAKAMAFGAPEGSLPEAESFARRAADALPSLSNELLLAKVLKAQGRAAEAAALLDSALARGDRFPRDREVREDARTFRAGLDAEVGR